MPNEFNSGRVPPHLSYYYQHRTIHDAGDFDDTWSAEDYDRRRAIRDGWRSDTQGY